MLFETLSRVPQTEMKNQPATLTIDSDEEEDDTELLCDWRGIPASSSKCSNKKMKQIYHGTSLNELTKFDHQENNSTLPLLVLDNTPLRICGTNKQWAHATTTEGQLGEGSIPSSSPSVVLETPISAYLNTSTPKATPSNGDLPSNASEFTHFLPRLPKRCSGGADVICLDSDYESDGVDRSASKVEKSGFNNSDLYSLEGLQKGASTAGDAVYLIGKDINSEEHDKGLISDEQQKESPSVTKAMEFLDNECKKLGFEEISKTSVLEMTDEVTVYNAESIVKDAEVSISKTLHLCNDEKESIIESLRMNSEARKLGITCEEARDDSTRNDEFSVPEVVSSRHDLDKSLSSLRQEELMNGSVKSTSLIQTSSEKRPSLEFLDSPLYKKVENIDCAIRMKEIGKDNVLEDNNTIESVEQVLGSKRRKLRKEDKDQGGTESQVLKETGNKQQRKDREDIRREKEEQKKRRQEDIAKSKQEKEEEKQRRREEQRLKKEEEKMQKASSKAEAAEMKRRQKEKEKWEKGKFALKCISAEIDTKVVERGLIGGHLLNRLAEKELCFHIVSNQVHSSIMWKMSMPDEDMESSFKEHDIPYLAVVLEAEEFCNMVSEGSLNDHVDNIQRLYPGYSICYLTNKLMSYISKRDQEQYKNPGSACCWRRPPVEEALAKFTTHFVGVRSRLCLDEADVADHIVGLTRSLAECRFRRKLTHLSISANGSHVPKDYASKEMIKKSVWLKALVAIPKLPPKCAVAIAKKFPSMRSLLNVYLDPGRTVHEKEFLLQDLVTEGLLREGGRRLGPICSKRVYRILMAQSGSLKTDDVEEGADLFQT